MKTGWKIGLGVAAVLVVIAAFADPPEQDQKSPAVAPEKVSSSPVQEPGPGVSMAAYSKLKTGMSYREAVAILGEEGEEMSSSEIAGIKTVMYAWTKPGGANMNAMFQNDKLVQKAQFGLD